MHQFGKNTKRGSHGCMTCVLCVDFQIVALFRSFLYSIALLVYSFFPKLPLEIGYLNCVVTNKRQKGLKYAKE